jgi:hypothetical protein
MSSALIISPRTKLSWTGKGHDALLTFDDKLVGRVLKITMTAEAGDKDSVTGSVTFGYNAIIPKELLCDLREHNFDTFRAAYFSDHRFGEPVEIVLDRLGDP